MSQEDSTRGGSERISGNAPGPEGYLERVLESTLGALSRVSLTPAPSRLPSQGEQLQQDSPRQASLNLGGVPRNLAPTLNMVGGNAGSGTTRTLDSSNMFKTSDPTPKEKLAQGVCELPRTSRGDDSKTIK